MKYDHVIYENDFNNLPEDQKRECFAEKWQVVKERLELEQALVPRLSTRPSPPTPPSTPPEPLGVKLDQPAPSEVEEARARRIFEQNPGISEVQIGSTIYFKRTRR